MAKWRDMLLHYRGSDDALMRVFRNSSWLFSSKAVTAVLSLVYLAVLTRSLGVEKYGQFVLVMSSALMLSSLVRVDTWQTIVHFGAPHLHAKKYHAFSSLAWCCALMELAGAMVAALAITAAYYFARDWLVWEPRLVTSAYYFLLFMVFCGRSSAIGILRAHDRFKDAAFADMAIPVVRTVGAGIVLLIQPSIAKFWLIWAAAEFSSLLLFWFYVMRRTPLAPLDGSTSDKFLTIIKTPVREPGMLRFLLQTNLVIIATAVREQLVTIVVGLTINASSAGLFRLAYQLGNSVSRISDIFARPLFTELTQIYSTGRYDVFVSLLRRSLKIAAISSMVVMIGLALTGKPLILVMAGAEYLPAYPLLLALGGASAVSLMGVGLDPLLQASGKAGISAGIAIATLIVIGAGLYFILPYYGAVGAAAVILGASIFRLILLGIFCTREARKVQKIR